MSSMYIYIYMYIHTNKATATVTRGNVYIYIYIYIYTHIGSVLPDAARQRSATFAQVRRAKAVHYVHHKEAVEDARLVRFHSLSQ